MKSNLLYFAMFLLILCVPFRGNEEGVRWLWADISWIPLTLIFISLMCIGFYLYKKERKKELIKKNDRTHKAQLHMLLRRTSAMPPFHIIKRKSKMKKYQKLLLFLLITIGLNSVKSQNLIIGLTDITSDKFPWQRKNKQLNIGIQYTMGSVQ